MCAVSNDFVLKGLHGSFPMHLRDIRCASNSTLPIPHFRAELHSTNRRRMTTEPNNGPAGWPDSSFFFVLVRLRFFKDGG